jgi:hypothetical protein
MRVGVKFFGLWCLLAPPVLLAAERTPHELYDAINALRVDPSAVYRVAPENRIELRRGDVVLSLEEGTLAFFSPLDGNINGAVFSGRGHALALPRDPSEKQQMGYFLGAPVLDQDFFSGYFRFTDATADELLRQFQSAKLVPRVDSSFAAQWEPTLAHVNSGQTLRILFDRLSRNPMPYFYAGLEGAVTGLFDVVLDFKRDEPFLLGQFQKVSTKTFYDVWTSHAVPGFAPRPASFHGVSYIVETSILPDNSMEASTSVRIRAETGGEPLLTFLLSPALTLDRIHIDSA